MPYLTNLRNLSESSASNSLARYARRASLILFLLPPVAQLDAQDAAHEDARPAPSPLTRLIVLGVLDHSGQLVSRANSPGALSAFIDRARPDAICIERPPEQAGRFDFYEFTYEVQGVILPYAATHKTELCPIDWMPPVEDQKLAFGKDLDIPPEIRSKQASADFVFFPDPKTLTVDLLAADDPATTSPITKWAGTPSASADRDFPRRLYLYRTFLQAERIRAVARTHAGKTVLVVVGAFHKPDIESILSHDPRVELIEPSQIGRPSDAEAERATTPVQRVAILSFNLLGVQAQTNNVDWAWVEHTLTTLESSGCVAQCAVFRIRLELLAHKLSPDSAALMYRQVIRSTSADATFSWTGVKDSARVDSYYDPFGNLTIRQRATLELARSLRALNQTAEALLLLHDVEGEVGDRKARQLAAYSVAFLGLK